MQIYTNENKLFLINVLLTFRRLMSTKVDVPHR